MIHGLSPFLSLNFARDAEQKFKTDDISSRDVVCFILYKSWGKMRKYMRPGTVFFIILMLAGLNACIHDEPNMVRIDDVFTLGVGEQVRMVDDRSHMLYISIEEVEDSRCPADVFCIDEGKTEIKVVIEDTRNSQFTTHLCLGNCSPSIRDIRSFVFYNIEYTVQVVDVIPYPAADNLEDPRRVILKLYRN